MVLHCSGDPKETGELDVEGVKRLWKSLHMDITQMSAKWLISLADDSKNGKLNFGEVCISILTLAT